jgi:hypothetical protein
MQLASLASISAQVLCVGGQHVVAALVCKIKVGPACKPIVSGKSAVGYCDSAGNRNLNRR